MKTQTKQMVKLSVNDITELIKNAISTEIQNVVSQTTQQQKTESEILTREEVKNLLKISYTAL